MAESQEFRFQVSRHFENALEKGFYRFCTPCEKELSSSNEE